jgi:peptidoglycan/LPS O-acetylase OafA/YrhL
MDGMATLEGDDEKSPARASRLRPILARFRRVTSTGVFVPEIDGLRCLAIGLVVLGHFHPPIHYESGHGALLNAIQSAVDQGFVGVQIFFAISGFILGLPFAKQHFRIGKAVSLKTYFVRRLTRLEPPYLIHWALVVPTYVLMSHPLQDIVPSLLGGLTYTYGLVMGKPNPVNQVTWSLEVEVQFYVMAPLLTYVFLIRPKSVRRALLVVAIAIPSVLQAAFGPPSFRLGSSLPGQIQYFLVGFLVADFYLVSWPERSPQLWRRYAWDLAAALALAGLLLTLNLILFSPVVVPTLIFIILAAAFRGCLANVLSRNIVIVTIGGMCYTIYLYHKRVESLLNRILIHTSLYDPTSLTHWFVWMVVNLIIILAVCAVLFVLFEKPFMYREWPQRVRAFMNSRLSRAEASK